MLNQRPGGRIEITIQEFLIKTNQCKISNPHLHQTPVASKKEETLLIQLKGQFG